MPTGSKTDFYLRGWHADQVLVAYDHALAEAGFRVTLRHPAYEGCWRHKAIWGDSTTAIIVQQAVPFGFGRDMDEGKRLCAQAEIRQMGGDTILKIMITPWMEMFDRPEIFLLSQDIVESMSDDRFSKQKMLEMLLKMQALGLPLRESQL